VVTSTMLPTPSRLGCTSSWARRRCRGGGRRQLDHHYSPLVTFGGQPKRMRARGLGQDDREHSH